jgi:glycosyltransferase involved in cell wall biosynthesis
MKLVLFYCDFLAPSGFSRVSEEVVNRLGAWCERENVRIDICATNFGKNEKVIVSKYITAYNARLFAHNEKDMWYRDGFLKLLQSKPYDLVWILNDFPVITPLNGLLKRIREQKRQLPLKTHNEIVHPEFKVIFYTPIDSLPPKSWFKDISEFDEIVTYTEYAKKEIQKRSKTSVKVIPHGFDTKSFYRIDDKANLRKKYKLPLDKYVFGTVNKNHARKDIGSTLIAFARFKEKYGSNAVLYLHTYHSDPTGINIHEAAERLGLKFNKDYFLPLEERYKNAEYTPSDMNEVYNCMDCFITTSMAEGWGLTLSEAMCCELPVIYGNHTSFKEIMQGDGKPVKTLHEHIQIFDGEGVRFKLDINETVERMQECFISTNKNVKYTKQLEKYDWDKISLSWQIIFNKHLR